MNMCNITKSINQAQAFFITTKMLIKKKMLLKYGRQLCLFVFQGRKFYIKVNELNYFVKIKLQKQK